MPFEPSRDERPPLWRPQLHRRDVLRGGAVLAAGVGAAPLLAACSDDSTPSGGGTAGDLPYQLATPDNPVEQPIADDNQPIEDGLEPETGGVFKILNYADYMAPGVMRDFGEQYDVEVEVTPYNNYDQMIAKLEESGAEYDLVFPGPTVISKMIYGKLLQPLNQSYIGNMSNLWPEYQDPWYDRGARYTMPYTVYTTGIGYRTDLVDTVPDPGYDLLWDSQYAGKAAVLDDYGEAISMSILRNNLGGGNINTDDQEVVAAAVDSLIEAANATNLKVSITGYRSIPEGEYTVSQCWSGDMLAARWYLPKDTPFSVVGYWTPEDVSQRVIGNDTFAIPFAATKPVLAHLFINNLLDPDVAEQNFNWNGYQPPLTKISVPYALKKGYIVESLDAAIVVPEDFEKGKVGVEQPPAIEAMWRTEWARFKAGG
ncbi:MAG TPA: spermidine/putrescine ABC transporter substrate-binding protein [Actinomycetes bacterium]|nr:spermidine/putrescine ABC transporter substrate-binding protein [Actinomycetes bacterium]